MDRLRARQPRLVTISVGGDQFELTEELLRVAGGLAAFSGFYFAVAMLTDSTYREEFLDELTAEMRRASRLASRTWACAPREACRMSATMVAGYRHVPGNHCGSTALRNLLAFEGSRSPRRWRSASVRASASTTSPIDGQSPSRFINGRVGRLEEQFCELTGAALALETFDDAEASWDAARAAVDAGRPPLLLTDLYYLDHYGSSAHFPGHAVVLAGYDDEVAYLSDTGFEELQTTRLENLAEARHGRTRCSRSTATCSPSPTGCACATRAGGRARDRARRAADARAGRWASSRACRRCARFADEVRDGPELEDWQWCGALLLPGDRAPRHRGRQLPAHVLALPRGGRASEARLAAEAAARWTTWRARCSRRASRRAEAALWARIGDEAAAVLEAEERLWPALAASSGLS